MHKIDWWRAEISAQQCEHPLSQLLASALTNNQQLSEQLLDALNGYADLLQFGSPSTDEANKLFHWSTGAVACLALTGVENTTDNPVARAGVALSRFRCWRFLPNHINAKLLCLPLSVLEANDVSPVQLQPGSEEPALNTFFERELLALNTEMESTAKALLVAGAATRPLYVYFRSQQQVLKKMISAGSNLLAQPLRLSPLRNYFNAFSAARQHYRHN